MSAADDLFDRLRTLALERPREARALAGELLDQRPPELVSLLERVGLPGEGRLRQVLAHAVRADPRRHAAVPQLDAWLANETDEFTRNALRGALETVTPSPPLVRPPSRDLLPVDRRYVDAYRHAATRLTHRVRNALLEAHGTMLEFDRLLIAGSIDRAALARISADLRTGFRAVARVVEFDTEDGFFEVRPLSVLDWLRAMTSDYAHEAAPIDLAIDDATGAVAVRVRASPYLLGLVFWNLWKNAQQAVAGSCRIGVRATIENETVHLLITDNGPGFTADARSVAFVQEFSTRSKTRGRGLLEVQDAAERLHGTVRLVDHAGAHRVRVSLPLAR